MMVILLTVASMVLGGGHYYLYRRLAVWPDLPRPWRTAFRLLFAAMPAGLVAVFALDEAMPLAVVRVVAFPFYMWMGLALLFFTAFVFVDIARLIAGAGRMAARRPPLDTERRRFLARGVAATAAAVVAGTSGVGIRHALGNLEVVPVTVPLRRLPAAFDGFTIAQITDLHIGPTRGGSWLREVVRRVNELAPDAIAITGDLVDGSVERLGPDVAALADLRAKHGVYFVTGNHEYYSGAVAWVEELRRLGLRVLRNERVTIGSEREGFDLAGVDDFRSAGMAPGHGQDVAKAVAGRDTERELVLLAHQPRTIFDAARHGVSLMLAGHTHGGQIWPIQHISKLVNTYVKGLHRHGDTWIYVSSGTGFWGPPFRVFSTAEITLVTLTRLNA